MISSVFLWKSSYHTFVKVKNKIFINLINFLVSDKKFRSQSPTAGGCSAPICTADPPASPGRQCRSCGSCPARWSPGSTDASWACRCPADSGSWRRRIGCRWRWTPAPCRASVADSGICRSSSWMVISVSERLHNIRGDGVKFLEDVLPMPTRYTFCYLFRVRYTCNVKFWPWVGG